MTVWIRAENRETHAEATAVIQEEMMGLGPEEVVKSSWILSILGSWTCRSDGEV